jgi:malate dehydrogenase
MSRDDLVNINAEVMKIVAEGVAQYAPNAFVIIITNPLDIMTYCFQKYSQLSPQMVVGMAGVLDSARFKHFLSLEFDVNEMDINTMVLGGHGDTMVPLLEYTTIGGIPLSQMMQKYQITQLKLDEIVQRTRDGGAEIINLLQTSAYYAPATSAITMLKSYLYDQKRLLCCCTYVNGEYNLNNIYLGVPVIIGENGVERIIELDLNDVSKTNLQKSAQAVQSLIANLKVQ